MLNGYSADGVCQKLRETFDKCGDFNLRPILCAGKNVYLFHSAVSSSCSGSLLLFCPLKINFTDD